MAVILERVALLLGALSEPGEVGRAEPLVEAGDLLERPPHRELALDPELQRLDVEHAGQLGVAGQHPVGPKLGEPLQATPARLLAAAPLDPEPVHEVFECGPVLLDLQDHLGEDAAEGRPLVVLPEPLRHFDAGRRAAQMVVEVDAQRVDRNHGPPFGRTHRRSP